MIVILDTSDGEAYNFTTRNAASEYLKVSTPTLREWLKQPFYLHKTLIVTHTSNEKVKASRQALFLKKTQKVFSRDDNAHQSKPINGSNKAVVVRD